jgi:hypothetical protein
MTDTERPLSATQIGRSLTSAVTPRGTSGLDGQPYPADEMEAAGIVVEWLDQAGLRDVVEDQILSQSDEVAIARTMVAYLVLRLTGDRRQFVFPSVEKMIEELGDATATFDVLDDGEQMHVRIHPEGSDVNADRG